MAIALALWGSVSTLWAAPNEQEGGLRVTGALAELEVVPGQSYTHVMTLSLGAGAQPMDLEVEARGFGQSLDGAHLALSAAEDRSPYSGRQLIVNIDKRSLHLEPGSSQEVVATIAVPNDLRSSRYATLLIRSLPKGSGSVGFAVAAHVPVVITPAGAQFREAGTITELAIKKVVTGQPLEVLTTFQNSGDRHFKAQNEVTITDSAGTVVANSTVASGSSILPTFSRQFQVTHSFLDRAQGLPPGVYGVESRVMTAEGKLLDSKKATFELGATYRPFPGIDDSSLVIASYRDEEPTLLNARQKTDAEVGFTATGKISGVVAVGKYKGEPAGGVRFSGNQGEVTTEKSAVKYLGIGVEGFTRGWANVAVHYTDAEVRKFDENSLFLAFRAGDRWTKLDNLVVQSGPQMVKGEIPISALNSAPVLALVGAPGSPFWAAPLALARTGGAVTWGLAIVSLLVPATALAVSRRKRTVEARDRRRQGGRS